MNLNQLLAEGARRFGPRTAIVSGETRITYTELEQASNRVANTLAGMGLKKGDRVVILLPNGPEYVIAYCGAAKAGAMVAPLDIGFKMDELASLFNHAEPRYLIAGDVLEQIAPALSRFPSIERVIEVNTRFKGQFPSFSRIVQEAPDRPVAAEPGPEDVAHIGYTSGPSSQPHGVMLTHRNLVAEADISARGLAQTENDIMMLFALPMHHAFGLVIGLLGTLSVGGKVVILTGLNLGTLVELIEREKGSIFIGVPYVYALIVNMAEQERIKNDLSSLRLCISGASCLSDDIAHRFKHLFHLNIGQMYGLTEGSASLTCTAGWKWKLGSAGKPLPEWQIKIFNEADDELPPGQVGEVVARGQLMKGYFRNPEATAAALRHGWLHTGDLGRMDEDGYLYITGLKKNVIIIKGQNVFPVDIEKVICSHPDVAEAVVVGVPDELRWQTVGAAVRPKVGKIISEEDIKKYCRQHLINYKVPRRVIFVDDIPRSAEGRVQTAGITELLARVPLSTPPR